MLHLPRFRFWPALAVALVAVVALGGARAALATDTGDATRDGVLSVADAELAFTILDQRVGELRSEVADVTAELALLESETAALTADQAELVTQVETSVRQNRELVVSAFITGGEAESQRLLASNRAADYQWQTYLLRTESVQVANLADRLDALRAVTDAEVLDLAERLDSRKSYLAVAEQQLLRFEGDLVHAQQQLTIAEAWELSDRAVARGAHGEAPAEAWERLRWCESRGDYRAVHPSGIYRGAYQFDRLTWRTMGGTGDPIDASPLEQDARARALYALRGNRPWPVCGRALP